MENSAIKVEKLSKEFNGRYVVRNLSLEAHRGEIFGFLGPNGSGKTTTIKMLCGILKPSDGEGKILGFDIYQEVEKIKAQIGYMGQSFGLYPDLTVQQNISFYSTLYNSKNPQREKYLIDRYGFNDKKNVLASNLSGGWKQRLALLCTLVHTPKLIFFDEPTAGVDPVTRRELWDLFYDLAHEGTTLFISTHYMEEAERCNTIAFLSNGERVACGSPDTLKSAIKNKNIYNLTTNNNVLIKRHLLDQDQFTDIFQFGDYLRLITDLSKEEISTKINQFQGGTIMDIQKSAPSIEDVFFVLTKEKK